MTDIIGIDPSLTGTAVCRWGGTPSLEDFEMHRFTSSPSDSLHGRIDRYDTLASDARHIVQQCIGAVIFIEGYSFASPGNSGRWLAEYGGILRLRLLEVCPTIIEVPPQSLKKFATGKGGAKKEMVMAHVAQRWNRIFDTSDEADAFCLAQLGLRYLGRVECDSAAQRDVIEKLKNPPVKKSRKHNALS